MTWKTKKKHIWVIHNICMCRAYMLTVNVFRSELVFILLLAMQDVCSHENGLKQKISRVCIAQYFILVFCVVCATFRDNLFLIFATDIDRWVSRCNLVSLINESDCNR
jgi:hypothetical protein